MNGTSPYIIVTVLIIYLIATAIEVIPVFNKLYRKELASCFASFAYGYVFIPYLFMSDSNYYASLGMTIFGILICSWLICCMIWWSSRLRYSYDLSRQPKKPFGTSYSRGTFEISPSCLACGASLTKDDLEYEGGRMNYCRDCS